MSVLDKNSKMRSSERCQCQCGVRALIVDGRIGPHLDPHGQVCEAPAVEETPGSRSSIPCNGCGLYRCAC